MINKLEIHGLELQPNQRDAYVTQQQNVKNYHKQLCNKLNKEDRRTLMRLVDAQNYISYFTAKDCYANGFCAAMKFITDNLYEEHY